MPNTLLDPSANALRRITQINIKDVSLRSRSMGSTVSPKRISQ
jgi:hypothetical protein